MNKVDVVICSLPSLSLDRVPGAPALLKAALTEAGYTAAGIDLNIDFFTKQSNKNIDLYYKLCQSFRPNEAPTTESTIAAQSWVTDSIVTIKSYNPKIVGLSVFTTFQHRATVMLAKAIRQELPDVKIVMGGFGLNINANSLAYDGFKKIELLKSFDQLMLEKNLADRTVLGSGLDELVDFVSEHCGASALTTKFNSDGVTFNTPTPNYDDYKLEDYVWNGQRALPVTGSKGCVRSCTFCDIPGRFGKFSYRSGAHIANEMIALSRKHNIQTFEFTDSLVNGSFKSFREWLSVLADYNDSVPEAEQIRWFGQYICRPQKQTPQDIYSLIKRSGVTNLVIGVESGSDAVLEAMKKKIVIQDVYDEFAQFEKHDIQVHVLMLSGFYNETWERYLDTLKFLVESQRYVASGTVSKISVGPPLFINEKMHLGIAADDYGIIVDPYDQLNWRLKSDPDNDFVERARRRLITQLVLDKLGIPTSGNSIVNIHQVLAALKKHEAALHEQSR